jgi:hypothetical protein
MVRWPVNNELCKEATMTNLKQLLQHFYGGTEKNHDQPQWLAWIRDIYFHVWSTVQFLFILELCGRCLVMAKWSGRKWCAVIQGFVVGGWSSGSGREMLKPNYKWIFIPYWGGGWKSACRGMFCLIIDAYFYSLCMTSFKQLRRISIAQNLITFLRRLH